MARFVPEAWVEGVACGAGGVSEVPIHCGRTWDALIGAGIATVDGLLRLSDDDLLAIPGIGPQRLHRIHAAVRRYFDQRATV